MIRGFSDLVSGVSKLSKSESVAFNIHLALNEELVSYCENLNKLFVEQCHSDISFDSDSLHRPHVTLYMGEISGENMLKKLFEVSQGLAEEVKNFHSDLSMPYNKGSRAQWIFIDALLGKEVGNIKKSFHSELRTVVVPPKWNFVDEPLHITIARLPTPNDEMRKILAGCSTPPPMQPLSIDISLSGIRGTCLGMLKSYPLR